MSEEDFMDTCLVHSSSSSMGIYDDSSMDSLNNCSALSEDYSALPEDYFALPEDYSAKTRALNDLDNTENDNPEGFDLIEKILSSCNPALSSYLERFKEAMIINSVVYSMSQETIKALFPKELGFRDLLTKAIESHRLSSEADFIKADFTGSGKKTSIPENYKPFNTWKKQVSLLQFS